MRTCIPFRPSLRASRPLALLTAGVLAGSALVLAGTAPAAQAKTVREYTKIAATGTTAVDWRGMGHGHGMSQYGAQGAAKQHKTFRQILAFYYPGTTQSKVGSRLIRVRISVAGGSPVVFASSPGLALSHTSALPKGYLYFRLDSGSHSTLTLMGYVARKGWKTVRTGLSRAARFGSSSSVASQQYVRVLLTDRSSTQYRGTLGPVLTSSGWVSTDNTWLNNYVAGVVPREMPASWLPAAVSAQAVAARTYALSEMAAAKGQPYDICDTDACQVYGGMAHLSSSGALRWTEDQAAVADNRTMALTYRGAFAFTQFSASNGGALTSGGEPYLVAKNDPYDTASSGDPYLDESDRVSMARLASYYHLKKVTAVTITKRDGIGPWGGRVQTATVTGTNTAGKAASVSTTGSALGSATGVYTDYLKLG